MIQERCNNVMLLRCHKNKTDLPDMPAIMKDFVMQGRSVFGSC